MADIHVTCRDDYGVATIIARKGVDASRIGEALELEAPVTPSRAVGDDGFALIGSGPGTWLAMREGADPCWSHDLREKLAGLASISDQSGAYVIYRLAGPAARKLLQRGLAIDMHPSVFSERVVVTSAIAYVGVVVWMIDQTSFEVAVYRSFSENFRHWLDEGISTVSF